MDPTLALTGYFILFTVVVTLLVLRRRDRRDFDALLMRFDKDYVSTNSQLRALNDRISRIDQGLQTGRLDVASLKTKVELYNHETNQRAASTFADMADLTGRELRRLENQIRKDDAANTAAFRDLSDRVDQFALATGGLWTTATGEVLQVRDMDDEHLANTQAYLKARHSSNVHIEAEINRRKHATTIPLREDAEEFMPGKRKSTDLSFSFPLTLSSFKTPWLPDGQDDFADGDPERPIDPPEDKVKIGVYKGVTLYADSKADRRKVRKALPSIR